MITIMTKISILTFVFFSMIILFSCENESNVSSDQGKPDVSVKYDYKTLNLPVGLPTSLFSSNTDPFFIDIVKGGGIFNNGNGEVPKADIASLVNITNEGAALGRVLFYDKKLSLNNTIACASCHHQDKAFSDGQAISGGFEGRKTTRNSMAILNPITQNNLFWDSRSQSIQDLSLKPIQNHIEMGMENIDFLVKKLEEVEYYAPLFKSAFGNNEITGEKISTAISQFLGSMTTANSKFDAVVRSNSSINGQKFSDLENLGKDIFFSSKAKCSSCHAGANFSAPDGQFDTYGGGSSNGNNPRGTANIGLDLVEKDKGKENGQFKIPSLRNITLTAPYMHDGRFKSLDQVLDHYTDGIKGNANLDPKFRDKNGNLEAIKLNELEKKAVIAFLGTLTDESFIKDPKYSDPFKR
jgi:cytochrome c peroxidase